MSTRRTQSLTEILGNFGQEAEFLTVHMLSVLDSGGFRDFWVTLYHRIQT